MEVRVPHPVRPDRFHVRKPWKFLLGAWRTITWRHIAWTVALGAAGELLFTTVSHAFTFFLQQGWIGRFEMLSDNFLFELVTAFFFLLSIVVADHAVRLGAPRFRSFVLAAVVAAFLGATYDSLVRYFVLGWFDQPFVRWWWKPVHPISHFMWYLLIGGFITFVYADLQRNRESAARLHAAVLRRTRAARDVLQTRLQAMQARIEPQFLFDTLGDVKSIYRQDLRQGQRTLDDLITYLRTAMPQMHDSASTLAREFDLIRSYVGIVTGRGGSPIRLAVDGNMDLSSIPFPPMLLLPLVQHAINEVRAVHVGDQLITLRALRFQDRLQVTIGYSGEAPVGDPESAPLREVREHLRALFDGRAMLTMRTRADAREFVIDIPNS
jgi:Histidine kinase